MPLTSPQRTVRLSPVSWRFVWLGLGLLLATWPAAALSQGDIVPPLASEAYVNPGYAPPDQYAGMADPIFGQDFDGRSGQAIGGLVRGGFVTGPGIGYEDGFAPLEFMPYFFLEDGMLFGDLRGFRSTEDHYGANVGLGYRQYVRGWNRIFGANFFYDYDNTSTQLFRQVGFGLETFGPLWDMRLNAYFPVTESTKEISLEFLQDSIRYSGNNILYDQLRTFGVHMKGLDHELGVPLPGRFLERHDVRAVAGWYHFQGDNVDSAWGWKGRLEGDLISNVHMGLEVSNDNVFDTNVVLQVAISYGGFRQEDGRPMNQFNRMTEPVRRQYTTVVQRVGVVEEDITALKPDGTPYFVEHVASNDPYDRANPAAIRLLAPQYDPNAPLGTYENPYLTIGDAQAAAGGDIIFTWTNSTFNNTPITLEAGVQTLGEGDGVTHTFLLQPFGFVNLPRAVNNADPTVAELRPLLTNITGNAVTLTSGLQQPDGSIRRTEFSGFRIGDASDDTSGPTGAGIVGTGVTAVDVDFVEVNYAQGDGILLNGVGEVSMFNTRVYNARGTALHVVGGTPRITFEGDGDDDTAELEYDDQDTPGGLAVWIDGTNAGSLVNLFGTSPAVIDYDNAGGVRIGSDDPNTITAGSARFGDINITDDVASNNGSIEINNASGAYTFSGEVNVDGTLGNGVDIDTLLTGGQVTFQETVDVSDRLGVGVQMLNSQGNVLFVDDVTIDTDGTVATSIFPGVSYQQNSGNLTFRGDLSLELGNGIGIAIGEDDAVVGNPSNNTGGFTVDGGTSIDGYAGVGISILEDDAVVQFDTVSITGRGVRAIEIDQQRENVTFNGLTTINNSNESVDAAVVLTRNLGDISFQELQITGALAEAGFILPGVNGGPTQVFDPIAGVAALDNPGEISIDSLNVTSSGGVALYGRNVGSRVDGASTGGLFTEGGILDTTAEAAIDVEDSVIGLEFDSVSSTQSARRGISLVDNVVSGGTIGLTISPGTNQTQAGGAIIQAALEGAYFENTGGVILRSIDFIQNGAEGIQAINSVALLDENTAITSLTLQNSNVIQNDEEGLLATNVPTVTISNSIFTQNGGTGDFAEISLNATVLAETIIDDQEDYIFTITDSTLTELGSDAIEVLSTSAGQGAGLVLTLTGSSIQVTTAAGAGDAALGVDWTGPMDILVDNNLIQVFNPNGEGVQIFPRDLFDVANIQISNNDFQGTAIGNDMINIQTLGPSNIVIDSNTFNQSGDGSTGMFLSLAANSNTTITNNILSASGDQARGVVFQSINGPANVTIFGNDFLFTDNDLFFDERGFDFLATAGVINFIGSDNGDTPNNIVTIDGVQGVGFPWFNYPINGQFTGSILVNGNLEP